MRSECLIGVAQAHDAHNQYAERKYVECAILQLAKPSLHVEIRGDDAAREDVKHAESCNKELTEATYEVPLARLKDEIPRRSIRVQYWNDDEQYKGYEE